MNARAIKLQLEGAIPLWDTSLSTGDAIPVKVVGGATSLSVQRGF